jgi:pyruvate,orthophosphate dikinase
VSASSPPLTVEPYVFEFAAGDGDDVALLGGKGAGLARLVALGLPVPPGFIVTCRAGRDYLAHGAVPEQALAEIDWHLEALEARLERTLGDPARPLLVSVRSGAPVSMPGMMDTVLNVGLTTITVEALARETQDSAFAWACYERLAESYARIVRHVPDDLIEQRLLSLRNLTGEARSRQIVEAMNELMLEQSGSPMPDAPKQQIVEAVDAVFRSWMSPRAKAYRKFRGIDASLGTAAVVQTMVFGTRGDTSGSGVAFTRDPCT